MEGRLIHIRQLGFILKHNGNLLKCIFLSSLCDPMDCSLPGFSAHGIFKARILEWVAIPFYRGSSLEGYDPGIISRSSTLQADSLPSEPPGKLGYS